MKRNLAAGNIDANDRTVVRHGSLSLNQCNAKDKRN
jgi:hypothetical protein